VADVTYWYHLLSQPASTAAGPDPESHLRKDEEGPVELEVTYADDGDAVVVAVSGDLDLAASAWLRRRLLQLLGDRPSTLIVALEQVAFVDATGLGALAEVNQCAHLKGTRFQIAEPRRLVRKCSPSPAWTRSWRSTRPCRRACRQPGPHVNHKPCRRYPDVMQRLGRHSSRSDLIRASRGPAIADSWSSRHPGARIPALASLTRTFGSVWGS
jgi:anti-sigma B factor antagonist